MVLDLGSLASVHRFAAELGADLAAGALPPLRGLVCNAGLQVTTDSRTEDGFETTFGVNHLGHLALVEDLVDRFEAPARIAFVSSGTHDPAKPTGMPSPLADATADELAFPPVEPGARTGRRRYTTSKLANVRTSYVLAQRLRERGITVNAFDPGLMPGTGLARDAGAVTRLLWRTVARGLVVLPMVNTTRTSGANLARLLTATELAGVTGAYFVGRQPAGSLLASYDAVANQALYRRSLHLIGDAARPDPSV
jgi:NAD(P)-dependent dehydrogenase (short-subunit alcohol dehydrogenase family)